ncbi:L,D-transpeptidase [Paracoccus aestuarii]|uniref:L,D-transpeptidase n=1 Tax=Paracoccus aestuarii TaxID=453842 RepID=A0A419A2L7_9RHOB|nr:L,D-transpeptidase [Paracoccus aestuarii]RJL07381.1 L,D-transpeptidase [Paracoccus aestuarii]WCQ99995.1 L,D-transpeptidase [Paracoccus aestuarii]
MTNVIFNRRQMLTMTGGGLVSVAASASLAQSLVGEIEADSGQRVRHNTASFRAVQWRDHFDNLRHGAIICDSASRAVHFWSENESTYLIYPCSVPMTEEFTRRGRTEIVLKRLNPTWIPTPNMRQRDPTLPAVVPPGPSNPLGTRALNLSWQYYRVHGIDDERKIGRRASNGCFGLFNHHVEQLYEMVRIGTQVVVL